MGKWTVYKHTFPDGKVYIGITSQDPKRRWSNGHGYLGKSDGKYHNALVANAIIQYGWLNISHEIVACGLSKSEANKMEIELIAQYKSNESDFGYNITNGGFGGQPEALKEHVKNICRPTKCNQTGIVYPSMKEASKQTGICPSSVWNSCKYGNVYHGLSFSLVCDEILEK